METKINKVRTRTQRSVTQPFKEGNPLTYYNLNLEDITLSEMSPSQKDRHWVIPPTRHLGVKCIETGNRMVIDRDWGRWEQAVTVV